MQSMGSHCAVCSFFMRTAKSLMGLSGSETSLGAQVILLVLSCCGSIIMFQYLHKVGFADVMYILVVVVEFSRS